jgi:dynein heavy chain 2
LHAGFYDEHREFIGVDKLQLVASMNPSSTVGRHVLSTRFTAIVRLGFVDYPDGRELQTIYTSYLSGSIGLSSGLKLVDDKFRQPTAIAKLAQTLVEVHQSVCGKFNVDEYRHYLFTPRELTAWVAGLKRYSLADESLLEVVIHEAQRIYRDR